MIIATPTTIIELLLAECGRVVTFDDLTQSIGGRFQALSSDSDVIEEWRELGITATDEPHLLRFRTKDGNVEVEFVFHDGRLVQAGVQVFGQGASVPKLAAFFSSTAAILGRAYVVLEHTPGRLTFSDNRVNGYLHQLATAGGGSVALRVADLHWCELRYGPNAKAYFT